MNIRPCFFLLPLLALLAFSCQPGGSSTEAARRPNVIFILADDLGYGDIGVYGQHKFTTPHLDQLARDGVRFTSYYSGSTVCAPSRASLLTGLHTGHAAIRGNREVQPEGQAPLPDSAFTLAELFRQAGYVTGAFGKWGLGYPGSEGRPTAQGFDQFMGYNCQRLAHSHYPPRLWNNDDTLWIGANAAGQQRLFAPELIQQSLGHFLRSNKDTAFFAYVPVTLPHAELAAPEVYLKKYQGAFGEESPYLADEQAAIRRDGTYGSQAQPRATYAAMVYFLDQQIGDLRKLLMELGIAENTLIVFCSDNGPHAEGGHDPAFFQSSGPFRGKKRDLYEGGIRVPMIACWPGQLPAGAVSEEPAAAWDWLATFSDLMKQPLPGATDGVSLWPLLSGKQTAPERAFLYWEFHENGGSRAIRQGNWKLVQTGMNKPSPDSPELYDLQADPGETNNLASQQPDLVNDLLRLLDQAHQPHPDYDWNPAPLP